MENLLLIFICFFAGLAAKKLARFPQSTGQSLNAFIIYISLPAMVLLKIPALFHGENSTELFWLPILSMWLMFFFCWGVIATIGKKLNWSNNKTGTLILVTGLANTSFVGTPLLRATLGEDSIAFGILADQPGEFLIVSTLGIILASLYRGAQISWKNIFFRVITFPAFMALVLAVLFRNNIFLLSPTALGLLTTLANTLVPLALFAVGFNSKFHLEVMQRRATPLIIGLSLRLLIVPLFFLLSFSYFFSEPTTWPLAVKTTLLESAMASQITAGIVATEFNLDAELANLMVTLSIVISLFTVPIWHWILFA